MNRWVLLLFAAVAASVVLTGCGDSELSKQELVARGDALCAKADQRAEALGEPATPAEGRQIGSVFKQLVSDLRALAPPADDRGTIESMLSDYDRGLTKVLLAFERGVAAGRTPGEIEANDGWRLLTRAGDAAQRYGFQVCGSEG